MPRGFRAQSEIMGAHARSKLQSSDDGRETGQGPPQMNPVTVVGFILINQWEEYLGGFLSDVWRGHRFSMNTC